MKRCSLTLSCLLTGTAALGVTPVETRESIATEVVDTPTQNARVISCAIRFPLDSVKFSEDQVHRCLAQVDMTQVSYIHVIATASSSGSGRHNLYLSTRRAGAIEAFLNNRYPQISVHAFGGGENPKFGKVARIFLVEHQQPAHDLDKGVQVAAMGPPEVIERITTKTVTKTEYREKPPRHLGLRAHAGPARTVLSSDPYTYVGGEIVRYSPWGDFGLRFRALQSDLARDLRDTTLFAGKSFTFTKGFGGEFHVTPSVEAGWFQASSGTPTWGASGSVGWTDRGTSLSFVLSRTNYVSTAGLGLGARL